MASTKTINLFNIFLIFGNFKGIPNIFMLSKNL